MDNRFSIQGRLSPNPAGTPGELSIERLDDGWRCLWAGARLEVHAPARLAERDGILCVASGSPRLPVSGADIADAWLELHARHGADVHRDVKGLFSVAFFDTRRQTASFYTDRFATESWCFGEEDGALCFSDRADAVPLTRRSVSAQSIFDYLFFHVIPSPVTLFREVRRLPPASRLDWQNGSTRQAPYWVPVFREDTRVSVEDAKARFMEIVRDSVTREIDRDDVGAFLSGGTDSSTVSGMLGRITGRPARTYSMGFDATGYDEMEYARIAAKHFKTDHHEYYVTPEDLLEGIPKVARSYDQPFGNSSAVPAWICASRARADGIGKLLAGDGGDELFGGNARYAKQRVFGWYDTIPSPLRSGLIEPLSGLPGMDRIPLIKKGVSYVEQASVPMPDRMQMYNLLLRLGLDTVFQPNFLKGIDTGEPSRLQRDTWALVPEGSLLNRMLAFDWKYTLADNDLPKVIGTTRLAGVDVGFPLLSDELLDFSLTLPSEWKLKGFKLRWLFKEALRGFLPDEIITKKKHGFGLPFGVWAVKHPGLKALACDTLEAFGQRGVMSPIFLHDLHAKWLPEHPGYYGELVWIVMMLEQWLQAYAPDWRLGGPARA